MGEVFGLLENVPIWRAATRGESVDWVALLDGTFHWKILDAEYSKNVLRQISQQDAPKFQRIN